MQRGAILTDTLLAIDHVNLGHDAFALVLDRNAALRSDRPQRRHRKALLPRICATDAMGAAVTTSLDGTGQTSRSHVCVALRMGLACFCLPLVTPTRRHRTT